MHVDPAQEVQGMLRAVVGDAECKQAIKFTPSRPEEEL